jgi:hypothetical protein
VADDAVQVVESVGSLDPTVLLLREFLHRSGALRAVAVVDGGPGDAPALVDCARLAPIEVTIAGNTVQLPHSAPLDVIGLPVPEVRQLPPFEVDAEAGTVAGAIGGIEHLAGAVRALAKTLGGRSVAMAQFETTTPDLPLAISARGDEPIVVSIGDEQFELDNA